MLKKSQNIVDQLFQILPQLQQYYKQIKKEYVDPNVAKKLFSVWKESTNKLGSNTYVRPKTVSMADVDAMQKAGLVKAIGDKIEITKKGGDIIKVMVLGDDRSVYEDTGVIIDHDTSLANTKNINLKSAQKHSKKHEDLWWQRFMDEQNN